MHFSMKQEGAIRLDKASLQEESIPLVLRSLSLSIAKHFS